MATEENMERCQVVEPKLECGQETGVAVLLDFEGENIIVFHGYFGLFVFDTENEKMLSMLDLKSIDCDRVQGDDCCEVRVTEDGDEIYLCHKQKDEYKEMYLYKWKEHLLYKTAYQREIPGKEFYDYTQNQGSITEGKLEEVSYQKEGREIKLFDLCEVD